MSEKDKDGEEIGTERLAWLAGVTVKVRLGGEEFTAVYRDTIPLGRAYFLVLEEGRKMRLVQTEHVVELATVEG